MQIANKTTPFMAAAVVALLPHQLWASETETMVTSWYGPGMQCYAQPDGSCVELMANGQPFNMDDPTVAAHKDLPFGTRLRVTNPENGETIVVAVQDRGPFITGRDLDLSRGAARAIGMIERGVAELEVEILAD
jgi:rare lipoprotein A